MADYRKFLEKTLVYEMTDEIRNKIEGTLGNELLSNEEIKNIWEEIRSYRHLSTPREEIEWYPSIDKEKCVECRICEKFCKKKVYKTERGKVKVNNPYSCVLICSHCSTLCPTGAISFPNPEDFRKYVKYYK